MATFRTRVLPVLVFTLAGAAIGAGYDVLLDRAANPIWIAMAVGALVGTLAGAYGSILTQPNS